MKPEKIPVHVDEPMMMFLWSIDEALPFIGIFAIGIITRNIIISIIIGFVVLKLYRKFKDSKPDGYMIHMAYWYGLIPTSARTLPNPFKRRYQQ